MTDDWGEPLDDLRWHWGEAYVINCLGLGQWTAERRDTHETVRDQTPLGLRDKIIADYSARKVPRHLHGQPPGKPGPGSGLPAESPPQRVATLRPGLRPEGVAPSGQCG